MPKSKNRRKRGKHKGKSFSGKERSHKMGSKRREGITRSEATALVLAGMMEGERKTITKTPNPHAPGMQ